MSTKGGRPGGGPGRRSAPFDSRAFRDALGQFVTGIAVITAAGAGGENHGMTISSFNSVSLDPPLILFSVDRGARSFDAWERAEGYAVNILDQAQEHLSNQFAHPDADRWAGVRVHHGATGAPLLDAAMACFECVHYARYDGGDHVIFVGRVIRIESARHGDPLIYFRGRYHRLSAEDERLPEWPLSIHYF